MRKFDKRIARINQYDWNEINFPSEAKDWKRLETISKSITLNILLVPHSKKEIKPVDVSKHKSDQIIHLMATDGAKMTLSCCKKLV